MAKQDDPVSQTVKLNGKKVKLAEFSHNVPFERVRVGSSIYVGFDKKHAGIYWQVCQENKKGKKQWEFVQHNVERIYEIKRVK